MIERDAFCVWIDRLGEGKVQKIEETLSPSFLEITEEELCFVSPVLLKGKAYLAEQELILHFHIATQARMPCAICNQMIEIELKIENLYHAEPLEGIRGAIYHFQPLLREAILLELPKYVECRGRCPSRNLIEPYMRSQAPEKEKTYFPFQELN